MCECIWKALLLKGKKLLAVISRDILDFTGTDSFSQLSKWWEDRRMRVVWEKACYCWWPCCCCCGWWWGMSCMSRGWFTLSHKLQTVSGNSDWGNIWWLSGSHMQQTLRATCSNLEKMMAEGQRLAGTDCAVLRHEWHHFYLGIPRRQVLFCSF